MEYLLKFNAVLKQKPPVDFTTPPSSTAALGSASHTRCTRKPSANDRGHEPVFKNKVIRVRWIPLSTEVKREAKQRRVVPQQEHPA